MGEFLMFPRIALNEEDTLASIESRLVKAITDNAKGPGIAPIYTSATVKQEAVRLHQNLLSGSNLQPK